MCAQDFMQIPDEAAMQFMQKKLQYTHCPDGVSGELETCNLIAMSQKFDAECYIKQNPDVAAMDIDPILHYVRHGANEGRRPAPWFDTALYVSENIDIQKNGMNPFLHYLLHGHAEERRTNSSQKKKRNRLIVSLTSFPARINTTHLAVETLLKQSLKADMVVLWLAYEEFPDGEKSLPHELLTLRQKGLTIKWCHDIKSYKKLIPALKEYPNDLIVTADDDIYYAADWLERLYLSYKKQPNFIHCHRAHKILIEQGKVLKYADWIFCINQGDESFLTFFTGSGGALYPPKSLYNDVLNENIFIKLAPFGDDIWFWAMAVLQGTKCVVVDGCHNKIKEIAVKEENKLWIKNVRGGRNDIMLKACFKHYPELLDKILNESTLKDE